MQRVAVVIPNWNGRKFLEIVLPSLTAQTFRDFSVVVVDNASDDDSVAYLKQHWPDVTVITEPRNLGFAAAVNHGVADSGGELIALLNNDLELAPDWLAAMVAAADAHPEAGSFSCKMLQYHHRTKIDEIASQLSWYGTSHPVGRGESDRGQYSTPQAVFSACAGAALYRRAAWRKVGDFDRDFFAYLEDVDWGFRAQLAGYTCWYQPKAVAYHMGGATSQQLSNFGKRQLTRNTVLLVIKNYPISRIITNLPKLGFAQGKTMLGAIKQGWLPTYLAAIAGAAILVPKMLAKRFRVQRLRRVSTGYLNTIIVSHFPLPSKLLRT